MEERRALDVLLRVRTAFRVFVTLQAGLLAAIAIVASFVLLPGMERLPQAITAAVLVVGLISIYPLRTRAWGMPAIYGALARSRVGTRWVEVHRPFQFAALLLVLATAVVQRLPAWLPVAIPAAIASFEGDVAREGLGKSIAVWTLLGLLASGAVLLLAAFAVLVISSALRPVVAAGRDKDEAANASVLWNLVATGVLLSSEVPALFTGVATGPDDWRWWMWLVFAVAIARRILVISLLMADDWVGLELDATLAGKALAVKITTPLTSVGLALACVIFLVLEPHLGVGGAASVIVMASSPAAWLLEMLSAPRGTRARA